MRNWLKMWQKMWLPLMAVLLLLLGALTLSLIAAIDSGPFLPGYFGGVVIR